MPADSVTLALLGSHEMDVCREALLGLGRDDIHEDTPLVIDLEVCAMRAERGDFTRPFEVPFQEAPLVIDALVTKLRTVPYEKQPTSPERRILRHVVHRVAEAA